MPVTRKEIAEKAKVHPSVVSAVLNGSKTIHCSENKRREILSLIKEMNYVPNHTARSLSMKKTKTIGILSFSLCDRYYASLASEFQKQLIERGYIGLFASWKNESEVKKAYDSVLTRNVDGIVTCHHQTDFLEKTNVPAVFFSGIESSSYDSVQVDYSSAVKNSLKYLTDMGHRRIGFVAARDGEFRFDAFKKYMEEFGLEFREEWCVRSSGLPAAVHDGVMKLLARPGRPTAIMARNDMAAISTLSCAWANHLKVPDDLSVIGFDNIEESAFSIPPLTTNVSRKEERVSAALDLLLARIEDPARPPRKILFESNLEVRGSCAPPKESRRKTTSNTRNRK